MSTRSALITGASSGLGQAMAQRFQAAGFRVLTVSRSEPEDAFGGWLKADLTEATERQHVSQWVEAETGGLDVLINNAGVGLYDTWAATREEDLRLMMELNVMVPVLLTQALLPLLEASGGTVVNTASVAGKVPIACMGAYCVTKYGLTAFSDSLRIELQPRGIHVINLVVGRISTGFGDRTYGQRQPPPSPTGGASPEKLAAGVWKAYRKRRRQVVYPAWYRLPILVQRLAPGFWDRLNRQQWGLS